MIGNRGRGRPRNLDIEIQVISLLSRGVPKGRIATQLGIHRNTVCDIQKRNLSPATSSSQELLTHAQSIENLQRERDELIQQQRDVERRLRLAEYMLAVETLLGAIEHAQKITRSVWSRLSMDTPLPSGQGTVHDLVAGSGVDPVVEAEHNELREALSLAMSGLTEIQRKILHLTFWDKQDARQIAGQVGLDELEVAEVQHECLSILRQAM